MECCPSFELPCHKVPESSCKSGISVTCSRKPYNEQAPLRIPIGNTLILIVCEDRCFDARVSNVKFCCWYHSIRREVATLSRAVCESLL